MRCSGEWVKCMMALIPAIEAKIVGIDRIIDRMHPPHIFNSFIERCFHVFIRCRLINGSTVRSITSSSSSPTNGCITCDVDRDGIVVGIGVDIGVGIRIGVGTGVGIHVGVGVDDSSSVVSSWEKMEYSLPLHVLMFSGWVVSDCVAS